MDFAAAEAGPREDNNSDDGRSNHGRSGQCAAPDGPTKLAPPAIWLACSLLSRMMRGDHVKVASCPAAQTQQETCSPQTEIDARGSIFLGRLWLNSVEA